MLARVDLPQPDSPATPDDLALAHHEVDAAHGGQRSLGGPVGHRQPTYVEQVLLQSWWSSLTASAAGG